MNDKVQKLLAIARDQAGTPEGDAAALQAGKILARSPGAGSRVPTVHFDTPWKLRMMFEFSTLLGRAARAVPAIARAKQLETEAVRSSASMVFVGLLAVARWIWPTEALGGLLLGAAGLTLFIGAVNLFQLFWGDSIRDDLDDIVDSADRCYKHLKRAGKP